MSEDALVHPIEFEVCERSRQLPWECGLVACDNGCTTRTVEFIPATQGGRMSDDKLPQRRGTHEVASFSAEATARFLGGGEIGRPRWADPEEQARQDEQREMLRRAFQKMTPILGSALSKHSSQTENSLYAHLQGALNGDEASYRMYVAMLGELGKQAFQP